MAKLTLDEIKERAVKAARESNKEQDPARKEEAFKDYLDEADHNSKEGKQKIGKFFRAMAKGDYEYLNQVHEEVAKDLEIGTDSAGGYLTPTEFRGALVEQLYKLPVIRSRATTIPMASDKLEVPVEASTPSTNWTSELDTITQSDPTFAQKVLTANNLFGISRMSRQLLADSAVTPELVDWIINRFSAAIGRSEDAAFMAGDDNEKPKGLRQETFSQTISQAAASLDADDLINAYYALPIQYRQNAVWIMHDDVAKVIRKLKDNDGQYIWVDSYGRGLRESGEQPALLGRPVLIQNDIPVNLGDGTNESEVYFGDLSYYLIGDRQQVFSEMSTEEGESFAKHRAAVKVGERVDGRLALTESFSVLDSVIVE